MTDKGSKTPSFLQANVLLVDFLLFGRVEDGEDARVRRLVEQGQQVRDESEAGVVGDCEA